MATWMAPHALDCLHCGETFTAERSDAKYCSGKCRKAASRKRQKPTLEQELSLEQRNEFWFVRDCSSLAAKTILRLHSQAGVEAAYMAIQACLQVWDGQEPLRDQPPPVITPQLEARVEAQELVAKARQAAAAQLAIAGIDPTNESSGDALRALDDYSRTRDSSDPVVEWYLSATEADIRQFNSAWANWQQAL